MTAAPPRPASSGLTLVAVHLLTLPMGAAVALYGPSLPAITERFAVATSTAGLLIGAHAFGGIFGILGWALLQRRLGLRRVAALSGGLLGVGSLLLALAPTWPVMLAAAGITGTGFGGNASGLNVYISRWRGEGSAGVLSSTAGVFGIGSILAPAVLGWVGLAAHAWVFAGVGVVALLSSPLLLRSAAVSPAPVTPAGARRPTPVALLFMAALALYVSVEVGIGGWVTTHLIGVGYGPATAARWTAAFWGAFTVGRFGAAVLARRIPPRTIAVGALSLGVLALALAVNGPLAPVGYMLAGLALAPTFPALFAWYAQVTGTAGFGSALFFLSGSIGASLLPPLIGVAADGVGPVAIPLSLAAIAGAGAALLLWLRILTRERA